MTEICEKAKMKLRAGRKVSAIGIERENAGIGLKEAKEKVEAHIKSAPGAYPALERNQMSGSTILAFLMIGGAIALYFFLGQ